MTRNGKTSTRLARALRSFGHDSSGNFAVAAAVAMTTLLMAVGFALDTGQNVLTRSNLQNALDNAVTSTARDLTTGVVAIDDAEESVLAFLSANGATGFASRDRLRLDSVVVDRVARTVSAAASADVEMLFPFLRAASLRRISVDTTARYSDRRIEVAMMLDVTGSMGATRWTDKIGDLRRAATGAVDVLLANQDAADPRVRVAIVPYAEAVNAGGLAASAVYVEKRGGREIPPPLDDPRPASASGRPDDCATERKTRNGGPDYSDASPLAERTDNDGKRYHALVNRDERMSACPAAALVPLTADRDTLVDSIAAFRASGTTAGGIGVQWTYYMLSPKWRSVISAAGLGDGPERHDPRQVGKYAILMTDGQFNTAFAGVSEDREVRLERGREARDNAERLCRNMKEDGIEIFAIGFDLNNAGMSRSERDAAKSVLRNCSTPDTASMRYYFEASTGAELDTAFRTIAGNIERLAITR